MSKDLCARCYKKKQKNKEKIQKNSCERFQNLTEEEEEKKVIKCL